MRYSIEYLPAAAKQLRKFDRQIARRILAATGELAADPRPAGDKQLVGGNGELRIRVGDHRVIYEVRETEVVVLVLRIGHRRQIYR